MLTLITLKLRSLYSAVILGHMVSMAQVVKLTSSLWGSVTQHRI